MIVKVFIYNKIFYEMACDYFFISLGQDKINKEVN